jgi:hypothetical protein
MPLLDFGESKEIKRRKAILEETGAILITGFEQDGESLHLLTSACVTISS